MSAEGEVLRVVAKYDYSARRNMELSFAKNDILIVTSTHGAWWHAELGEKKGLIPSNYVTVMTDDKDKGKGKDKKEKEKEKESAASSDEDHAESLKAKVLYDYVAQRDVELSLKKGTVLSVQPDSVKGKWWMCTTPDGKTGKAPRNYLKLIEHESKKKKKNSKQEELKESLERSIPERSRTLSGSRGVPMVLTNRPTASATNSPCTDIPPPAIDSIIPPPAVDSSIPPPTESVQSIPPPPAESDQSVPPPPAESDQSIPPPPAEPEKEVAPPPAETEKEVAPPPAESEKDVVSPPPAEADVRPPSPSSDGSSPSSSDVIQTTPLKAKKKKEKKNKDKKKGSVKKGSVPPPPPEEPPGAIPPPPEEPPGAIPPPPSDEPPPSPPPLPPDTDDLAPPPLPPSLEGLPSVDDIVIPPPLPSVDDIVIPPPLPSVDDIAPPPVSPDKTKRHRKTLTRASKSFIDTKSSRRSKLATIADDIPPPSDDVPPPSRKVPGLSLDIPPPPVSPQESPLRHRAMTTREDFAGRPHVAVTPSKTLSSSDGPAVSPSSGGVPSSLDIFSPSVSAALSTPRGRTSTLVSRRPRPRGAIPLFTPQGGSSTLRVKGNVASALADGGGDELAEDYMNMMNFTAGHVPRLATSLINTSGEANHGCPTLRGSNAAASWVATNGDISPSPRLPQSPSGPRYIFADPDTSSNVRINRSTHRLQGATLPKLIAKVTDARMMSKTDVKVFIMMYRNFSDSLVIMDLLANRFNTPPRMPEADQESVQMRVWYVLKEWISLLPDDFTESPDLAIHLRNLVELMAGSPRQSVSVAAETLRRLYSDVVEHKNLAGLKKEVVSTPGTAPKVIAPSGSIKDIRDISPIELARQLTLMRYEVFRDIRPREFCNLAWTKKDAVRRAPNIVKIIKVFNGMGALVTCTILSQSDARVRGKYIKYFLDVAQECRELRNYTSTMEITAALAASPIARLNKSWSNKNREQFKELEKLMLANFRELRSITTNASPPCIPYLGLYFTDLVFIEEGNPSYLKDAPNLINWEKALMSYNAVEEIQRFQPYPFNLTPCSAIQVYLNNIVSASNMSDTQAYQMSLTLEPRESKK